MFFYLSRIFTFLLMPYTQMFAWFLLALILKNKVWKRRFFMAGMVYLVFFSNRFIVNQAISAWEVPPTPYHEITQKYDVGIVLGGMTNLGKEPRDRVYFYKGADRITHAFQLYKLGKIQKILVTGGSSSLIDTEYREADNLRNFLLMVGVDENDILLERDARNTHENAMYSEAMLSGKYPEGKHLVITSAFHMKRSLLCFRKTSLEVDGFSTDFYSTEMHFDIMTLLVPDASAFLDWQLIIRELEGMLFYKMAGYI